MDPWAVRITERARVPVASEGVQVDPWVARTPLVAWAVAQVDSAPIIILPEAGRLVVRSVLEVVQEASETLCRVAVHLEAPASAVGAHKEVLGPVVV